MVLLHLPRLSSADHSRLAEVQPEGAELDKQGLARVCTLPGSGRCSVELSETCRWESKRSVCTEFSDHALQRTFVIRYARENDCV